MKECQWKLYQSGTIVRSIPKMGIWDLGRLGRRTPYWRVLGCQVSRRQPKVGKGRLVYCCAMKEEAGFHVGDAEFASRVRESFSRQGLMKHLGAELVELTAGHAAI